MSVTEQIAYSSTRPVTTHSLTGGTLTITYSCKLQLACGAAYIVTVPRMVASGLSSASVGLRTSVGGINASFTAAPATLSAASDAGGITLRVPASVSYQVTARTYVGKTTVTVPRSLSSARTITARTNVGAIVIAPA